MTNASTSAGQLRAALRRLAGWQARGEHVISAYLDLRPEEGNPQVRSGQVVLRDALRDALRERQAHTPEHQSISADAERLSGHVENELLPSARAAALFAAHADGLFEALTTAETLSNDVTVSARPRLLPLAQLADFDPAVVALADTNTLRIFASRSGALDEVGLLDDESDDYQQTEAGGWSQARFQRHVEEHREAFADLAAQALEETARRHDARILLLAVDEVTEPLLRHALSAPMRDLLRGVVRCEMRATLAEVEEVCLPVLEGLRVDDAHDAADRLIGAAEADGMGIFGLDATRRALELGQVLELVLDAGPDRALSDADAEPLVHLAAATDARIRFARDHAGLRERGGAGGLLRFRLDRAVNEPASETEREAATVGPTGA